MSKKKKTVNELLEEALVLEDNQPYEVPENWKWVRMGSVITLLSGRDVSAKVCNSDGKGIPYIMGASNIVDNELTIERWIETPTVVGVRGDVLISVKGTVGKIIIQELEEVHLSRQIMALRCNDKVLNKYLYLYIQTYIEKLKEAAKGIIPGISRDDILNAPFPLVPLNEQKRIAEKVERLLGKVEEAQQLIEEAKETYELRRAAILDKAFRGELTRKWRETNPNVVDAETLYSKIKESQLVKRKKTKDINNNELRYELPSTWKWVRLGDVFTITSGGTPKRSEPEYYEGDIPWIKTGEVKWNNIYESEERITSEAIANSSAKLLPINTVLVAMYGQGLTRGRASILGIEAACNQAVCALLPNEYVSSNLLFYYFMEGYQRFRQIAKGGNQENLSATVISDFLFPLPPLEEQKAIVDTLQNILNKEVIVKEVVNIEITIDELKQSILSKVFRGELGTNDPSEENAIEVLKEVLQEQVR
ncbi:restriction endonuclease subunit S [Priestia flexa]|uniref:restriction endonuclease subunit S n=1 Tax=Priestia flexa TaxID=86664 RepID=UPI001CD45842|nr:restriction endonuclease subunit S [Priestia flexa]MCA1200850.1 restriction endonuclease subunit S [Priestia flexa]